MVESGRKSRFLRSPRARNIALGCLSVLVVGVLFLVLLYFWAITPGPQVPSQSFAGAETLGIAHLQGIREDPAVQAMTGQLLRSMQTLQAKHAREQGVPAFIRWITGSQGVIGDRQIDRALRDAPRDGTVYLESVSGEPEPRLLAAVNLSRYPRTLRFSYQIAALIQDSESVQGYRLLRVGPGDGNLVLFVEDTLLWGQGVEVLRRALERRPTEEAPNTSTALLATFASRQERWNVFGAIENREDSLKWISDQLHEHWPKVPPGEKLEQLFERIVRIDFGLDVLDEDSLEGFLDLVCRNQEEAVEIASLIETIVLLSGPDPHFTLKAEASAERVRIFLHFREFSRFVTETLEREMAAGAKE